MPFLSTETVPILSFLGGRLNPSMTDRRQCFQFLSLFADAIHPFQMRETQMGFDSYHFHCLHRIILITKVKKNLLESSTSLSQISSQVPFYLLCAKPFAPVPLLSKESPPAPFLCLPQTNVIKTIASSSRVSSERAPSVSSVETAARRIKTTSAIPTFYNSKFEWCERPHSFMD